MAKSNSKSNPSENNAQKVILENKYRLSNMMISLIVAIFLFIFDFWAIVRYDFRYMSSLLVVLVSLVMYIVLLSVLSKTSYRKRKVSTRQDKSRDEVIRALVKEVEGIEKAQKTEKVNDTVRPIFIGSTDSKIYHKVTCRYAKNIKPAFRLENNNEQFFKSKKFSACGSCLKKK